MYLWNSRYRALGGIAGVWKLLRTKVILYMKYGTISLCIRCSGVRLEGYGGCHLTMGAQWHFGLPFTMYTLGKRQSEHRIICQHQLILVRLEQPRLFGDLGGSSDALQHFVSSKSRYAGTQHGMSGIREEGRGT